MRDTTDASVPAGPDWDWARMVLRPWAKGGHSRLYVRSPSGADLGWLDQRTGEVHASSPAIRPALERFLRHHVEAVRTGLPVARTEDPGRAPVAPAVTAPTGGPVVAVEGRGPARPLTPAERRRKDRWLEGTARAARARGTLFEAALWAELERSSPFVWLREHVVGDYRLDFYSPYARLAVEVDGSSHRGREDHDVAREDALLLHGIVTRRLTAAEVEDDTAAAVAKVNRAAAARSGGVERDPGDPHRHARRGGGGFSGLAARPRTSPARSPGLRCPTRAAAGADRSHAPDADGTSRRPNARPPTRRGVVTATPDRPGRRSESFLRPARTT